MEILPQLIVNSMIAGSIFALASCGLSLIYGLLRVLNFAHGHMLMVGAYLFYYTAVELGLALPWAGLLTLVFSIVFAALVLRIFVLPFFRHSFLLTLVSSIALSTILESVVSMVFGVNVKSLTTGNIIHSIEIAGVFITPIQILIISSAVILLSLVAFLIHSTSVGRKIRALSANAHSAQAIGVSQTAISYGVFILGTVLTCYAGVLIGYETNLQPTMGTTYTIKSFATMILGGLGNIWGTVAGSYILGLVENLSIGLDFYIWGIGEFSIPAGYKDAFAFSIILVVLLFKPEGLFSRRRRLA